MRDGEEEHGEKKWLGEKDRVEEKLLMGGREEKG